LSELTDSAAGGRQAGSPHKPLDGISQDGTRPQVPANGEV